MKSVAPGRLSLRHMAEEAYRGFERERIASWRRKSASLLSERLAKLFAVDLRDCIIDYDEDGTARAVVNDDLEFAAPANPTISGLYLVHGDQRIQVDGVVALGRCLAELEAAQ